MRKDYLAPDVSISDFLIEDVLSASTIVDSNGDHLQQWGWGGDKL